jgi:hypothetical protein
MGIFITLNSILGGWFAILDVITGTSRPTTTNGGGDN